MERPDQPDLGTDRMAGSPALGGLLDTDAAQGEGLVGSALTLATAAAERYAAARKDRLADTVIDVAAAVRRSGRRFEGQQDWLADAIDLGAGKVRDMAEDLRDTDIRTILFEVRALARDRPNLFVAGSIAIGLIAGAMIQHAVADLRRSMAPRPA